VCPLLRGEACGGGRCGVGAVSETMMAALQNPLLADGSTVGIGISTGRCMPRLSRDVQCVAFTQNRQRGLATSGRERATIFCFREYPLWQPNRRARHAGKELFSKLLEPGPRGHARIALISNRVCYAAKIQSGYPNTVFFPVVRDVPAPLAHFVDYIDAAFGVD
jgi:hypothetical protein